MSEVLDRTSTPAPFWRADVLARHGVNITPLQAVFKGGDTPGDNIMIYEVDVPTVVDQQALHDAAAAHGASLNDAFLAGITGGLRRYHAHHGAEVGGGGGAGVGHGPQHRPSGRIGQRREHRAHPAVVARGRRGRRHRPRPRRGGPF